MISKKGKFFVLVLLFALMMFVSNGTAYALLTNGGFETGDTSGWLTYGDADVVTTAGDTSTYDPTEGIYFLELTAGMGTGVYTTASQLFTVSTGQWVTGWAAFDARDEYPYNDSAYVKVLSTENDTVWYETVLTVGDFGDGPWQQWESDPLTGGTYTLKFGVANKKDNANSSVALFDGATVAPEPVSMLLVGIGLAGLPLVRRFRGFREKLS